MPVYFPAVKPIRIGLSVSEKADASCSRVNLRSMAGLSRSVVVTFSTVIILFTREIPHNCAFLLSTTLDKISSLKNSVPMPLCFITTS